MFVRPMFRSTNVPFDQCSVRRMFRSTNVPFDQCSIRPMFHSTNVPFDQCSFDESAFDERVFDELKCRIPRETPAFDEISLAFRGIGAYGAAFVAPSAPVKEETKSWGARGAPLGVAAYAAFGGDKKNWSAFGAPNGLRNLTRAMRIPNMCLVLKLDNGKVVSIANEQNYRQTESPNHQVAY